MLVFLPRTRRLRMMARLGHSVLLWLSLAPPAVAADTLGAELEPLVRRYRMEVYQTFQNDRSEYDRYVRALQTLTVAYQLRGATDSDRQDFAEWLQASRRGPAVIPLPPWVARVRTDQGNRVSPSSEKQWRGERVGPERTRPARKPIGAPAVDPSPIVGLPWINSLAKSSQWRHRFRLLDIAPLSPMAAPRSKVCAPSSPLPDGTDLVDVGELTSLIDGYNQAVRSLEALLFQETTEPLPRLTLVVRELEELEERQRMQAIYVTALSPTSALAMPPHRSTDFLQTDLKERLRGLRSEADAAPPGETQTEKLRQIDALLRQLEALSAEVR